VSVGTSIVPPWPRPPPADTPDTSPVVTTSQVTPSLHDFAVSLGGGWCCRDTLLMAVRREISDEGARSAEQVAALVAALPPEVKAVAAGRAIRVVWKNNSGGLTCEVSGGPDRCFVKWAPAASGIDLASEAARLA
jgi:hypothetical protein